MSNPFSQDDGPQPPKLLKTPVEIVANLRQLQQHHDPLIITFEGRSQRFQSFVIEVDRDQQLVVLDEMIPRDGERFLQNGETFKVEGFRDGVRISWQCESEATITDYEGARCYFTPLPVEATYHQRRGAFRAPLKQSELIKVTLASDKLRDSHSGYLLDISATGCKLRFAGNLSEVLQSAQVYERFTAQTPFGALTTPIEMRHIQYDSKLDITFVGARFYRMGGPEQRLVERFVYQLQREARRVESDGLF